MEKLFSAPYFLVLLLLVNCSGSNQAAYVGKQCWFNWNSQYHQEVLLPILKKHYGAGYIYYALEDPSITQEGNLASLVYSLRKNVDVRDEMNFVIKVDACSSKVIEFYVARW